MGRNFTNYVSLFSVWENSLHCECVGTSAMPVLQPSRSPSPVSSISLPRIQLRKLSTNESAHMLRLIEPQLTSSYRQAFIPQFERPVIPHIGYLSTSNAQRKLSQASSRRMSTLPGLRRRESNVSQLGGAIPQDGHSRLSLQPGHKQHRPSVVSPRLSETDALAKLRAKQTVPVHSWEKSRTTWSISRCWNVSCWKTSCESALLLLIPTDE